MGYHIYLIANQKAYNQFYEKYINHPLIYFIKRVEPVYLDDCEENRLLLGKLKTRYNTLIKTRLRKLGCIYAHKNALQMIVNDNHINNLILEEDAIMIRGLPEAPDCSTFLGGWITPYHITKAGKIDPDISPPYEGINRIEYESCKMLMAHAYYLKYPKEAQTIISTLLSKDPIKAYDHHLSDNQYIKNYYYPPIFVQSRHRSSIDRKINQNHLRSIDYGINYSSQKKERSRA